MPQPLPAATIITAHNNADFDALAAMVAASKLYPGAVLVFPGSQEKNLRNFFIQSATYMFDFRSPKDVDFSSVQTLVLVDTRQRSRLMHVQPVLDKPGVAVHVYDHHPDSEDDMPYTVGIVAPWGSTTAILVREIRARGLSLAPDEATILGLGIFEDTGLFTFNSTTEHDFEAAAWLRTQQMDLVVISDLLSRDLNAEQVSILNDLLESASLHEIKGVKVVITTISSDYYIQDFALLVHKMMDMENIRVLIAIGQMQDRIQIVARSRTPDVNVGQICVSLGGGGHAYAASASVKDRTIAQVKDEVFGLLYSHINPQFVVRDLMSKPAISIEKNKTIADALAMMTRLDLKAMPVLEADSRRCVGVIERQTVSKASAHGLGHIQIEEYMHRDCATVAPGSDLYPVMEIIVGQRQPLVPVIEDEALVGVLTRTDLINILIEEPARIPETLLPEKARERNIRALIHEQLPADMCNILEKAGQLAEKLGYTVYAVGGFIRDILLRRPNLDLDLVVEGDGIAFARALAGELHGRLRPHSKFKTAIIVYNGDKHIDVATARLEYYEYPAALPTVELSSIKMDLYRRDFTINALAVQLNPGQFGRLADFFASQRDIKERVIRVLHSLSFVEDPTRILRAIRFEQRYGFKIGGQTERLIKNAMQLNLITKLSQSRLFNELRQILDEASAPACLRRMQQFGILEAVHPALKLTPGKEGLLDEAAKVLTWYRLLYLEPQPHAWRVYLLALCSGGGEDEIQAVVERVLTSKRQAEEFLLLRLHVFQAVEKLANWGMRKRPVLSEVYDILHLLPVEGLLYLMARSRKEFIRKHISLYLTTLKGIRLEITGRDLIQLFKLEPGPLIGELLARLHKAKIDGHAPTRSDEINLAERLLRTLPAEETSFP